MSKKPKKGLASGAQMRRIEECPSPWSSAAHLLHESMSSTAASCKAKLQQLPLGAKNHLSQLKNRLQHDIQSLQHKKQLRRQQVVVSCFPQRRAESSSSTSSSGHPSKNKAGAPPRAVTLGYRIDSNSTNHTTLGGSNPGSNSLGSFVISIRSVSGSQDHTTPAEPETQQYPKQGSCVPQQFEGLAAAAADAKNLTNLSASAVEGKPALQATQGSTGGVDASSPAGDCIKGDLASAGWVPASPVQSGSIPVAHNINLSPRDTDTSYSSVLTTRLPDAVEAVATTAAAAHAAAERVKELTSPVVPTCVLEAAEASATAKAAKRAVHMLRTTSAPEQVLTSAVAAAHSVPAAQAAAAAAPTATANIMAVATGRDVWLGSCLNLPAAAVAAAAPPAAARTPSSGGTSRQELEQTAREAQHRRSKSVGGHAVVEEQSWASVYCLHPLKDPAAAAIEAQLEEQKVAREAEGSTTGSISSHSSSSSSNNNSRSLPGHAAAASMTAAAAAVYSTVAADVEDAMQREGTCDPAERAPSADALRHDDVSKALSRLRLHAWLDNVVNEMQATGVLPPHRVYLWIRRPVRAPPTRLERVQQSLATPLMWLRNRVERKRRRERAARNRAALMMPVL